MSESEIRKLEAAVEVLAALVARHPPGCFDCASSNAGKCEERKRAQLAHAGLEWLLVGYV